MKVLITGCAGFIGFHLTYKLLKNKKYNVIGLDNLNTYYDLNLKKNRIKKLKKLDKNFKFYKEDIINKESLNKIFKKFNFDVIINLAAQAGVRYSINNPKTYFESNLKGFFNILELSKDYNIKQLFFASSSSVYGNNLEYPWNENTNSDFPLSFYAATKKSNELMAHAYSNIYKINCVGLRFFTVYGEWGRPDMALHKFTESILKNEIISIYNYGENIRDFTNIHDVVNSIVKLLNKNIIKNESFQIYNLGSNKPIKVIKIIKLLEKYLKMKSRVKFVEAKLGDANKTYCDNSKLTKKIQYKFKKNIDLGVKEFVNWYLNYYKTAKK